MTRIGIGEAVRLPAAARSRLVAWTVPAALLLLISGALAGGSDDRPEPSALVTALSSGDEGTRRNAAEQSAKQGSLTIERVARGAGSFDDAVWGAFADAMVRRNWPLDAVTLVAAAHDAAEAHRRRLIGLARRLDPRAGTAVKQDEIDAMVRKVIVAERGLISCRDPFHLPIAIHGHAGVAPVLKLLREHGDDVVDSARASTVLAPIAQPEDLPALRELLLAGKSGVAAAMNRLAKLGVAGAPDALIDAVRAGRFDGLIAVALYDAQDRRLATQVLRESLSKPERPLTDEDRKWAATVFAEIGSTADVPILETWSTSCRDASAIVEVARALMRLGSPKGVEMLVRIVGESQESATPPGDATRLRPEGFHDAHRLVALKALDVVATQSPVSREEFNPVDPPKGPFEGDRWGTLDRVAASVRAWWDGARDRIRFDAKTGRWRRNGV